MTQDDVAKSAAWARVELGMTRAEFDLITPAELHNYIEAWKRKEYREEVRLGKLRHTIAASAGSTDAEGNSLPLDYFIPLAPGQKPKRKKRRNLAKEMMDQMSAACAASGIQIVDTRKQKWQLNQ